MKTCFLLLGLFVLFTGCLDEHTYPFESKWQSLNDRNLVIEISNDQTYSLYRNGELFPDENSPYNDLSIAIVHHEGQWFDFNIHDNVNDETFTRGKMEVVNENRIRIYFLKHHDILDLADEFYRTTDLVSFDAIMNEINQSAE